jgi:hypothetical protein
LKGSSATSAKTGTEPPPRTGQSSAPPTRTRADGIALAGPSRRPDPRFNAYRRDLADVALAGDVIASHYAEPLGRTIARATTLRAGPSDDAEALGALAPGEAFAMLDNSLGWAWGYAGGDRRVGYVRSDSLGA